MSWTMDFYFAKVVVGNIHLLYFLMYSISMLSVPTYHHDKVALQWITFATVFVINLSRDKSLQTKKNKNNKDNNRALEFISWHVL